MKQAHRFSGPGKAYEGLTELGPNGPRWTGRARPVKDKLFEPLSWRKPARIFVNSMSDLFHKDVPDQFIVDVFGVMALAHWHTFLVLTKRPDRMRAFLEAGDHGILRQFMLLQQNGGTSTRDVFRALDIKRRDRVEWQWPLPNVHLGVSVEDQKTADERIPRLLGTPAAVRWVSYEPALGPVDFTRINIGGEYAVTLNALAGHHNIEWGPRIPVGARIDGIVMGGESGAGAEPMHPVWAQRTRNQCAAAGVAFFFKQWGAWQHGSLVTRKGEDHPLEFKGEIVLSDGQHAPFADDFDASTKSRWHELHATMMARVGKKAAGRVLDGRTHDELPAVRA